MVGGREDGRWEVVEGPPHFGEGEGWEKPIVKEVLFRAQVRLSNPDFALQPPFPARADTEVAGPASQGGAGAQRPAQ